MIIGERSIYPPWLSIYLPGLPIYGLPIYPLTIDSRLQVSFDRETNKFHLIERRHLTERRIKALRQVVKTQRRKQFVIGASHTRSSKPLRRSKCATTHAQPCWKTQRHTKRQVCNCPHQKTLSHQRDRERLRGRERERPIISSVELPRPKTAPS